MMQRWSIVLLFLLAACGQDTLKDEDALDIGATLYTVDFESQDAFETGTFPESQASLTIAVGQYHIEQTGETAYLWGQGGEPIQDGRVSVEVSSASAYTHNLYGVMCRVTPNGAGYAFLISSDGFGAVARTDGESMSMLFDWREHEAIQVGETNTVRGVCVDDYLALYVNDTLIGDVEDQTYTAAGEVGLMAGVLSQDVDQVETVKASFDNLTVEAAGLR